MFWTSNFQVILEDQGILEAGQSEPRLPETGSKYPGVQEPVLEDTGVPEVIFKATGVPEPVLGNDGVPEAVLDVPDVVLNGHSVPHARPTKMDTLACDASATSMVEAVKIPQDKDDILLAEARGQNSLLVDEANKSEAVLSNGVSGLTRNQMPHRPVASS
jgi:hypothetical protein